MSKIDLQLKMAARWGDRPISELVRLIDERQRQIGETGRDALIATAIDVLVSIRALTRKANPSRRVRADVQDTGMYGGYSSTLRRRVLRSGVSKYSASIDPRNAGRHVQWATPPNTPQKRQHVYLVTPELSAIPPYYVVATSPADAERVEAERYRKSVNAFEMLAQNALSAAMAGLSTRNPPPMGGSVLSKSLAAKVISRRLIATGGGFELELCDNLKYSLAAVRGGQSGVNLALAKAANKIAGRITRESRDNFLIKGYKTPFPEILRTRI